MLLDTPLSESESEKPILHVYLFSDPRQDRGHFLDFTFQRYTELMQSAKLEDGGIPFDNFFTMPGGFVARQVAINDPYFLQLTWRHFEDNSVILTLPLNAGTLDTSFQFGLLNRYRSKKNGDRNKLLGGLGNEFESDFLLELRRMMARCQKKGNR